MVATSKTCRRCGKIKSLTDYYVHPQMGDGRLNICKECKRSDTREYIATHKEQVRKYEKSRACLPHRIKARKHYATTKAGKEALARASAKYALRYPGKRQAHIKVGNAIRDGRLTKAPCEVCGSTIKVHGHHDDYSRPLDVVWLCPTHHKERHGIL